MDRELHVTDDLSAYLANELDQNGRSRVESHLRECEICRNELDVQKRLDELLRSSQSILPGPEIVRGVMQRVHREQKIVFQKRLLPWLAAAAVLAAVLLLLKIQKETPVPGEVVKGKKPPVIKPINPLPAPQESPQTETTAPPVVKNTTPKEPIVKPEPEMIPEEPPQVVQQEPPQPSISPEEAEVIAKIDELENMDLISNYDNLENLELAIIGEGGESRR